MKAVIGVDVGGTYTDLFWFQPETGAFKTAKVPSQRGDEATGFQHGLRELGEFSEFAAIVHGTTVGTNALLERKGAKLGVITTKGFRDVLEMRRRDREKTWGLSGDFTPIASRDMRLEVRERVEANGTIREPLNEQDVIKAVKKLVKLGAKAIAICFINSYVNTQNEKKAKALVELHAPHMPVTVSHEILPEIREFERTSTTALNAYLQPVVGDYLQRLETALVDNQFTGQFHIIQSNGGVMSTKAARDFPIKTALSGPAAGVIAAQKIAAHANFPNIITGDLGGTSFDVALIAEGKTRLASQTTIDFGLVIRTPMIEMTTIGAGGGSLAHVDKGGFLRVGPESAGSRPGPACYGQGNDKPTLTDANLVLGRINGDKPIGGRAKFNLDLARLAVETYVAKPLNLTLEAAAESIIRVADAKMAGAIRLVSIEKGHDPKNFALMPFGGGGALHAAQLIDDIGLKAALIPRFPGVTSALGCVLADVRHDQVQTINKPLAVLDLNHFNMLLQKESDNAINIVKSSRLDLTGLEREILLDMHYIGQTHTISVALPIAESYTQEQIENAFNATYLTAFGRLLTGLPKNIVNLRVAAIGKRPAFDLNIFAPTSGSLEKAESGVRKIYLNGMKEARLYRRLELPVGAKITGPAILEQDDATILIGLNQVGEVDSAGNLILRRA